MEHIIGSNLLKFLEQKNIFCDKQHRFRKGRSWKTQLLSFVDEVTESREQGKQMDAIVIDFSKAFDKVSNSLLLR